MSVLAIAHRGDPVGERENTPPVFAAAVEAGADMRAPEQIERMHARGTLVSVWTIDRREDMEHFLRLGVDAVITNSVTTLVELLERVC